ncbi:MAG TPA: rhodanese-like domain-containing protein [Arenimonas sp.]|uniref:rhodanese-like domain-containing protein n=1 Tax=Arenimonas sp. TaxID=1872635 RepID=UPI002D7E40FF|nr:rhodanese-like domain-containing protein [Arenimonas sp.]HEU0151771.1 rhodanese-like domain-containing protein [Arenimonas sp.]
MRQTIQQLLAQAKAQIREINGDELRALQARGTPVIDVREPAEFAAGHLPGAVNIPRGVLEFEVDGHPAVNGSRDPALGHRDQPVVLYCRSGGRSALSAEALQRLGFSEPLSLAGGYLAWTEGGGEVQAP